METVGIEGRLVEFEGFRGRLPLVFTGIEIFDILTMLISGESYIPPSHLKSVENTSARRNRWLLLFVYSGNDNGACLMRCTAIGDLTIY